MAPVCYFHDNNDNFPTWSLRQEHGSFHSHWQPGGQWFLAPPIRCYVTDGVRNARSPGGPRWRRRGAAHRRTPPHDHWTVTEPCFDSCLINVHPCMTRPYQDPAMGMFELLKFILVTAMTGSVRVLPCAFCFAGNFVSIKL